MKRLKISAVRDLTFGRHSGRIFDGLDHDFVVVHGPNESGKSTLAEFLTWAIGGPWRAFANNTEAFRGNGDGKLGGRLLGTLGADPVDLLANFELLRAGTPRDKRTGYVGSTEVDGGSFQKFLGGITPADFELMYRCYGATLGDIGSGGSFENLFAQFAMGGTSGVRNPREALDGLRRATNEANRIMVGLTRELREIDKEIKAARSNPDLVQELMVERDGIDRRLDELDRELGDIERHRSLLSRVIDGRDHRTSLDRARAELAGLPEISPAWHAALDNAVEIVDLTSRVVAASRAVDAAESQLVTAAAAAGMDVTSFEKRSLDTSERVRITGAASALTKVRHEADTARAELADVDGRRQEAETAVSALARTIGVDEAGLERLDAVEAQLPELVVRTGRWLEDYAKVVDAEAQLAGAVERDASENGKSPSGSSSKGLDPRLVAVAVLVVAGVSVVHWGAAIVVALGAAAFFVIGQAGRSAGDNDDRNSGVDNANLVNLRSRLSEHRTSAQQHRRLLDEGLGDLARYVTTVDLAPKQLAQLGELASRRNTLRDLDARVTMLARRVTELEPRVASAEREVRELLEPRAIGFDLVNAEFEKWFAKYESAVRASEAVSAARSALSDLRDRLNELTASVASEIDGLTPVAIAARVNEKREAASRRRAAENSVREAEARVRGANLDSPDAEALLRDHPDLAELKVQEENASVRARAIRGERDQSNARLGEIRVEIARLEGTEILPGLLLKRGDRQDAKDEAETRHRALSTAHELLGAAIDEHERENQDPVVARASDLVAEVVPGWGTVIKRRDEAGKLLIERVGSDGRVGDHAISDGGRALLYLAIRLAFAQQDASRRQISLPIICDDPLIHFDDTRQQAAVQLLKKVSADHQVVLFTCERDTRDFAASLGATVVEM